MSKPRVFASSTYYDLKYIRDNLSLMINDLGYEPILFEKGDIYFNHKTSNDDSCYKEINTCDVFVMIIGGRYGSKASSDDPSTEESKEFYKKYNSICKREYETALQEKIPTFLFVENAVLIEYETFKKNRENSSIVYSHVDSVNVFYLLDDILSKSNNFIKGFTSFDEIQSWLKEQWAGFFKTLLKDSKNSKTVKELSAQISELKVVADILKEYSEALLKKVVATADASQLIQNADEKVDSYKFKSIYDEPLIRFLRSRFSDDGRKLHSKTVYESMRDNDDLIGFLKSISVHKSLLDYLMENRTGRAERDYLLYRKKYFGNENDEEMDDSVLKESV